MTSGAPARPSRFERFGLGRPELRAWALYDVANSAYWTVVVTALFPIYYGSVAAAGREDVLQTYTAVTSAALAGIALLGPVLGAISDTTARKKPLLALFVALGAASSAGLFLVEEGDWRLACALFAIGNVGVAGSFVFYDALLPSVARADELDRVSTAGYALGYLGGGALLALNLAWILHPGWFGLPEGTLPTRLAFVSVGAWWIAFTIPLLRRVREPARRFEADEEAAAPAVRAAFTRLLETLREVRSHRQAFLLLLAMLVYNDGIATVIRMATVYGESLGIDRSGMILAILLVQLVGVPFAFASGRLAARIGAKRAILVGLAAYGAITLVAWRMDSTAEFFVLASGVGMVMGGCQSLSRSLFASMVPAHKAGEFFGLFGVLERFSAVLGPLAFFAAVELTGDPRAGVLPLLAFFGLGALLLSRVDVEEGRRAAREADARAAPSPGADQ
jgi:MFS transporter, UMF1 family